MHVVTTDRKARKHASPCLQLSIVFLNICTAASLWVYYRQTLVQTSDYPALLTLTVKENKVPSNEKLVRVTGSILRSVHMLFSKSIVIFPLQASAEINYSNCTFPFHWHFKACKPNNWEYIRPVTAHFCNAVWQIPPSSSAPDCNGSCPLHKDRRPEFKGSSKEKNQESNECNSLSYSNLI